MTNTTKHTPGPWTVTVEGLPKKKHKIGIAKAGTNTPFAYMVKDTNATECIELFANAVLIAAAPELLEACKYVLDQAGLSTNSPSYIKLQQAIAEVEEKNG